ncbi:MAG: carbohydrate kinase family protein [Firmicutes bacterium]|nr:carbohydrate kinase family protein [Bacillota bacterium]
MVPDLVTVGHIVKEMIQYPDRTIGPVLGSPVAYSSVVAATLGAKVGVVTLIGSDMPRELLKPFIDAGVDTRGIVNRGADTTTSILTYFQSGDKQITYPKRAPAIVFEDIPESYRAARFFYVCTMDWDVPVETIKELRKLGATLAVDLGGYGGAHSSKHPTEEEKRHPDKLREFIGLFDIIRASIEDCRHLLGTGPEYAVDVAKLFVEWGAKVGVITLGERGSVGAEKDRIYQVPALSGKVVDTTGAGDSFSAGFLVEYMKSGDVERSMRFASAVALHVCEGTGGVRADRMPKLKDIESRLKLKELT